MLNVMRLSSCDKQRKTGVNTLAPALSSALFGRESDARPLCIFIFITLLFSYVKKNHIGRQFFRRLSTIFPMEAFGNDRQGRQGSTKPNSLSRDDASRVIDSRREHATIKVKLRFLRMTRKMNRPLGKSRKGAREESFTGVECTI
jgi:hypothetical protein